MTVATLVASSLAADERFLDDPEITRAVRGVLRAEEGVTARRIEVSTRDGIVLLGGTVGSLLEKEWAATAAETIKGVRAVVDRTTVDPVLRPDPELERDVRAAFKMDPAIDAVEVAVSCDRGRIRLSGRVDSSWEKRICADLAKAVRGVREVHNQIEVVLAVERADSEIEAEIRRRWELSPWIDEGDLSVAVENGHVRISGVAGSASERSNAHLFSYVAGVREINSSGVQVKPGKKRKVRRTSPVVVKSDDRLERDVKDSLRYDPRVATADISVDAEAGLVTLSGSVGTLAEMKAAESDVRNTIGVLEVQNQLTVRPGNYPGDDEVQRAAAAAFERDPYLSDDSIDVDVRAGLLTLRGQVDSRFEKDYAESFAHGIRWIRRVESRLTFRPEIDVGILSDKTLRRRVSERVYWNPFLDSSRIGVEVEAGEVILSGRVGDYHELAQASKVARDAGARKVENRLVVAE